MFWWNQFCLRTGNVRASFIVTPVPADVHHPTPIGYGYSQSSLTDQVYDGFQFVESIELRQPYEWFQEPFVKGKPATTMLISKIVVFCKTRFPQYGLSHRTTKLPYRVLSPLIKAVIILLRYSNLQVNSSRYRLPRFILMQSKSMKATIISKSLSCFLRL